MCIHCSLRKQKCRLKSTTTNGWRHFGQLEQRKSSVLFPIQSEKSPDSGFLTCDSTKKCIMPSSRERHKGIIGKGHDLRLGILLRIAPLVKVIRNPISDGIVFHFHLAWCVRRLKSDSCLTWWLSGAASLLVSLSNYYYSCLFSFVFNFFGFMKSNVAYAASLCTSDLVLGLS